ncbi:glycoside hydrolase family 25 protein [Mucilaginibacter lacusdianchii]|uniref:glycoside hydrolase family 25 protein n=1 Tax=Mucilaginibacter lacusdianchii TaxID=2684211 RepID=UPI00131E62EF|nr:glycoside hydrolase family 25 protein [Mucilaginibacter sp. JXJ CY 39]
MSAVSPKPIPPKKPTVTKKPVARKKALAKKKKTDANQWPMAWKIALAGILLILLSPFYYGYVVKMFTSTWRWVRDIGSDPNYRTYKSFAIDIPRKYSIHGIDVSYAQGKIDWHKVKAMQEDSVHITFAFIKATEGLLTVDPYFKRNWREAPKTGIICGAYHYFRPYKSGLWQARFFLQNVDVEQGDLPLVVDIEQLDNTAPAKMRQELQAFLKHVENRTHVKPIIYSGLSFYRDYLQGHFDEYPLWIAHYYKEELKVKKATNWWFWQHSDKAHVNGINHAVDFNCFKGDSISLRRMLVPL